MKKTVRIEFILVFYFIAVALSSFFRVSYLNPDWYLRFREIDNVYLFIRILRASGPMIGGILCILLFRNKYQRTITLTGDSLLLSIIYFFAPVLLISLVGIDGKQGENIHLYGLATGMSLMIYCLFEETGWRGFLQDALRGISNPLRFIVIGILWYGWHLNYLMPEVYSLKFGLLFHLPSCILGSWIIGMLADKYKSIMVAAAIHCLFNVFADLNANLRSQLTIAGGTLVIWIVSSHIMEKRRKKLLPENPGGAADR